MLFSPLHHSKIYSCCPRFSLVAADPEDWPDGGSRCLLFAALQGYGGVYLQLSGD